ncbi:TPA: AbiV family abortive infection protein [Vibrio vulnificus]|uniref:AbiV family abortive infection protein n=1 Tax=Vibrio campbellii TaxID=680 RepID=UPI001A24DFBC|nr:AbiV family abortive infection protein [Vibrio parahaemolyticus]HAS6313818.1 AbiV family abortive infection protein [Vibrio vulnificus]HCG8477100.1 AbiV family abortive infection protein [Vibrio parahaemolyticus]HDY7562986.1 AbiV family abortive infection protein [Vibrio vulnificus]
MKLKRLSNYKYEKIAYESLKNALRLHLDSILLFKHGSYPSAFQLSVLSLEEFAKAKWVDHCYYTTLTNNGFPKEDAPDYEVFVKFEQQWLKLLYMHPEKQFAFIGRELFDYSPSFVNRIKEKKLEFQKQQSTYVTLERGKGKVDTTSQISIPSKKINEDTAKQMISLLNHEFVEIHDLIVENDGYWGIWEMDEVINERDYPQLFTWPYRTGLKSRKWNKVHHEQNS